MPAIKVKLNVIVPKEVFNDSAFIGEMWKTITRTTGPDLEKMFKRTTQNWKLEPTFKAKYFQNSRRMGVFVGPYGNSKASRIYRLVNLGSPSHRIPRNGFAMMRFRENYQAATRPGSLISSQAFSHGRWRVAFAIQDHPGFPARKFDETIADVYRSSFETDIADAIAKAAKREAI